MAPKRSTATSTGGTSSTTSRTKKSANLAQPILSFQTRKPSLPDIKPTKSKSQVVKPPTPTLSRTPSLQSPTTVQEIHLDSHVTAKVDVDAQGEEVPRKRKRLDVKSKQWDALRKDVKVQMGGMKAIHANEETHDDVHHILRIFDMTSKYGPCVGVTRLERWERAKKWGLNPPDEIRQILTTEEGEDDVSYRENVLYGWLG